MKIIDPSIEILESTGSVTKDIEVAARNCYLSYDRSFEGSDLQIVNNLLKRKHYAMLEFGKNVIFTCPYYGFDIDVMKFLFVSGFNRFVSSTYDKNNNSWIFSMNPRTAIEIYNSNYSIDEFDILNGFRHLVEAAYPDLILERVEYDHDPDWNIFNVLEESQLSELDLFVHGTITVKGITTRTVLAQWTRHRLASYAVTSMRYINWTKDRFGSELTFVTPAWYISDDSAYDAMSSSSNWEVDCSTSEDMYFEAIEKHGMKPEEARCKVLPDIRTDIVCKASLEEWSHIFKERCSNFAGPEIRRLMISLNKELHSKHPGLFKII